ncbi:hypothetical protein PCASD_08539 [Puccinia coronata f. sp. avenae]|uniref:Uncharacterized protein n=1 Tax=Puccinia coronata f. sp. avenae TaxID=200324 RepID=A0A2N5UR64_9BASI|nr:hypothetical protein PCASD_08539 [Puccinia coronata f. sp. avenae]
MSNPNQKQPSNNNPSSSANIICSSCSSPSIPNQAGKSTKERTDKQIGALKDALSIPFLASPPPSSHDGQHTSTASHSTIPIPSQPTTTQQNQPHHPLFHYTPTPYTTSSANTTH